jgi:hypothetical protein
VFEVFHGRSGLLAISWFREEALEWPEISLTGEAVVLWAGRGCKKIVDLPLNFSLLSAANAPFGCGTGKPVLPVQHRTY